MSRPLVLIVRSGRPTVTELAALVSALHARRAAARRADHDTATARAPWTRGNPNPRGWRGQPRR